MSALDGINHRYGRVTVLMASAGLAGDKRELGDEAGAKDTGVHHALGRYAGGEGVSPGKHACHARSCYKAISKKRRAKRFLGLVLSSQPGVFDVPVC